MHLNEQLTCTELIILIVSLQLEYIANHLDTPLIYELTAGPTANAPWLNLTCLITWLKNKYVIDFLDISQHLFERAM